MVAQAKAVAPSKDDVKLAQLSSRLLSSHSHSKLRVQVPGDPSRAVELPAAAAELLVRILGELALGNPIHIIPASAELTMRQAADFLGVSRPFLAEVLKKGKIKVRRAGTQRRVSFKSLMDFKSRNDARRDRALGELTQQGQELNM
jgi:excisionase family DNA binding protein